MISTSIPNNLSRSSAPTVCRPGRRAGPWAVCHHAGVLGVMTPPCVPGAAVVATVTFLFVKERHGALVAGCPLVQVRLGPMLECGGAISDRVVEVEKQKRHVQPC